MNAPIDLDMIQEPEEWRPIAGFAEYEVSSLGRVRRATDGYRKPAGHILRQSQTFGYATIALWRDGKSVGNRVNRLVCRAFHGEPPSPQHHAAHIDGVRGNNRAENLRWADPASNMRDKITHGTNPVGDKNGARKWPERLARGLRNGKYTKPECTPRGEAHGKARLTENQVREIRSDQRSRRQIAQAYGVSKCAIDGIKSGKTWRHVA